MDNGKLTLPSIAPSEYTDASRIIHRGPCIVKSVYTSVAAGGGNCKVYDGLNNKGKLKANIIIPAGDGSTWRPGDGTDFDQGLYLEVTGTDVSATVTFIPESRKAFI